MLGLDGSKRGSGSSVACPKIAAVIERECARRVQKHMYVPRGSPRPKHQQARDGDEREGLGDHARDGDGDEEQAVVVPEVVGVAAEVVQRTAHALGTSELADVHLSVSGQRWRRSSV